MIYKLLLIAIPLLVNTDKDLIDLLNTVKEGEFDLEQYKEKIRDDYCNKFLFKGETGLECKFSKSITKKFRAKRVLVTSEPSILGEKSISFILSGYPKDRVKTEMYLAEDFELLCKSIKTEFTLIDESFYEGGESQENLKREFISRNNVTIMIQRLFGGCFSDKRIIVSVAEVNSPD